MASSGDVSAGTFSASPVFQPGDRVRVHSVVGANHRHLNGEFGVVYEADNERYLVKMMKLDQASLKRIRPTNLELFHTGLDIQDSCNEVFTNLQQVRACDTMSIKCDWTSACLWNEILNKMAERGVRHEHLWQVVGDRLEAQYVIFPPHYDGIPGPGPSETIHLCTISNEGQLGD